jgi:hypothetical protein
LIAFPNKIKGIKKQTAHKPNIERAISKTE